MLLTCYSLVSCEYYIIIFWLLDKKSLKKAYKQTNKTQEKKQSTKTQEKKQTKKTQEIKSEKAVPVIKPKIAIRAVGKIYSQAWQCEVCDKIFSARKHAMEHMQDAHP